MPLNNLIIENHFSMENNGDAVGLNNVAVNPDTQMNPSPNSPPTPEGLPKAVKLIIRPDQTNEVIYQGQIGYWSIRASDISISGFEGESVNVEQEMPAAGNPGAFINPYNYDPQSGTLGSLVDSAIGSIPLKLRNTEFGFTTGSGAMATNAGGSNVAGWRINEQPWYYGNPTGSTALNSPHYKWHRRIRGNRIEDWINCNSPDYTIVAGDGCNDNPSFNGDVYQDSPPDYDHLTGSNIIIGQGGIESNPAFPTDVIADVLLIDSVGHTGDVYQTAFEQSAAKMNNEVWVYVIFKNSYQFSGNPASVVLQLDFDGSPTFIASSMQPQPSGVPSIHFDVNILGNDSVSVLENTINSSISESNEDKGRDTSTVNYSIKLPKHSDKSGKIASFKINSESGYYFSSAPKFLSKDGNVITTVIKSKNKVNGKVTSYTLDLIYSRNNLSFGQSILSGNIEYSREKASSIESIIKRISFGNSIISDGGETREIKVYGTPGSSIALAVNESFENTHSDIYGADTASQARFVVNNANDTSILSTYNSNSSTIHNYAKEMPIIVKTIDRSRYCSFRQKFPSTHIAHRKVHTGKTGATQYQLDSITDLRVGDRVYSTDIEYTKTVKITGFPTANSVTFDTALTLPTGSMLQFKRSRLYNINIIKDLSSGIKSSIPSTEPTYLLKQYLNPTLTLRHSMTGTPFSINGLANGETYDFTRSGKYDKNVRDMFQITLLLDLNTATQFDTFTKPKFNSIYQLKSDWTNSVYESCDGANIYIYGISTTALSQHTLTITYNVLVNNWGKKDIIMELPLDNFVTYS